MAPWRSSALFACSPRKTKATPDDALAYFGPPDRHAEADEVHVSVTFTYDRMFAEYLAEQWKPVTPVKIGGVAYGDRGEDFVPGRYTRCIAGPTSRGSWSASGRRSANVPLRRSASSKQGASPTCGDAG
jgi:hypothetical protein